MVKEQVLDPSVYLKFRIIKMMEGKWDKKSIVFEMRTDSSTIGQKLLQKTREN